MVRWLPLVALVALAACGYRGDVSRIDMRRTDVAKAELKRQKAAEQKQVEAGLTLAPEAQPQRVDEILTKPGPRPEDPFSLPPQ